MHAHAVAALRPSVGRGRRLAGRRADARRRFHHPGARARAERDGRGRGDASRRGRRERAALLCLSAADRTCRSRDAAVAAALSGLEAARRPLSHGRARRRRRRGALDALFARSSIDRTARRHRGRKAQFSRAGSHRAICRQARAQRTSPQDRLAFRQSETEALFEFIKSTAMRPEEHRPRHAVAAGRNLRQGQADAGSAGDLPFDPAAQTSSRSASRPSRRRWRALPMSQVETLLASAADPRGEFAAIWPDITRARISAFLQEDRSEEVPAADVAALASRRASSQDPNQSGLLAWYAFKRNQHAGSAGTVQSSRSRRAAMR